MPVLVAHSNLELFGGDRSTGLWVQRRREPDAFEVVLLEEEMELAYRASLISCELVEEAAEVLGGGPVPELATTTGRELPFEGTSEIVRWRSSVGAGPECVGVELERQEVVIKEDALARSEQGS